MILAILHRWHKCIVWRVQYRIADGTLCCRWYLREEAARQFAKLVYSPTVVEVSAHLREIMTHGFVDDPEPRQVLNS
jgi:hypothetical protein